MGTSPISPVNIAEHYLSFDETVNIKIVVGHEGTGPFSENDFVSPSPA